MRPRPGGRGEPHAPSVTLPLLHCFNAATTRRPWRAARAEPASALLTSLQCGHDPEAVESITFVLQ